MVRLVRVFVCLALVVAIIPLGCGQEQEPDVVVEDPRDRLVEILQLTDDQMEQLESGTGTLQLREDQVDILSDYVTQLLDGLEPWVGEAQWQEVQGILEAMLAQGEVDLEALGPVIEAIDDCVTAMHGIQSSASIYTGLRKLSTESVVPLQSENTTLDGSQSSAIVYTPKDSGDGEKHFERGMEWSGGSGLRFETVGTANPWSGALAAYCDAGPFGGASVCVSQQIVITVPADNTDITIRATVLHFTATIGTPAPLPIAGGSTHILTASPSGGTGSTEWAYSTLDSWFDWYDLASWLLTIGSLGVGEKVKTAADAVKLLNEVADIADYMTALEERGEEEIVICNATSLPAGNYVFEVGMQAQASATVGYASAYAFGAVPQIEVTQSVQEEPVYFPDPNLEAAIREAIGKPTGEIYTSDLQGLTHLLASHRNITDLTGLEYCINLTYLALGRNQISDISPLADLTNLEHLRLDYNGLADIAPVANLVDLTWLELRGNHISELWPLSNLTKLTYLHLGDNQLSEISHLEGLTNVTLLYLDQNQISDISALEGLTNLTGLDLYDNEIGDISALAYLTQLQSTQLQDNQISDIKPLVDNPGLGGGDYVDLRNNPLSTTSRNTHIPALQARGVTVDY